MQKYSRQGHIQIMICEAKNSKEISGSQTTFRDNKYILPNIDLSKKRIIIYY